MLNPNSISRQFQIQNRLIPEVAAKFLVQRGQEDKAQADIINILGQFENHEIIKQFLTNQVDIRKYLNCWVGIEIEAEKVVFEVPSLSFWMTSSDGSLRNSGVEFTTLPGLNLYGGLVALKQFQESISQYKPSYSHRCGVHYHVNVRPLTLEQVKVYLMLWYLFEGVFFKLDENRRVGNRFCWPLHFQFYQPQNLLIQAGLNDRYLSCNISSLRKFGTLEFRIFQGNSNYFRHWVIALLLVCCRQFAIEHTPKSLLKLLEKTSESAFLNAVFKELTPIFDVATLKETYLYDVIELSDCLTTRTI